MNKKPRSDSKLDTLPEHQLLQLRDGLLSGWKLEDARSWLIAECGVSSALSSVSSFYKRHCAPVIRERRQLAALKAEVIIEDANRTDWNAATLEMVKQVSFEMMSGEKTDPKVAEKFIKLILKSDAQEQSREKLKAAAKSKIEEGLDALFAEIKGNKKAEALFAQLQEVVAKA